jgi:hypothetical protein
VHKVIKNFIPESYSNLLLAEFEKNIRWGFGGPSAGVIDNYDKANLNIRESVQYVHSIAENAQATSPVYSLVMPLVWFFEKETGLTVKHVRRIKANSLTRDGDEIKYNPPHIDVITPGCISMVYYINNSDGDTIIFDEFYDSGHCNLTEIDRVTPQQGQVLILDSNQYHASSCPLNSLQRMIINFIFEIA